MLVGEASVKRSVVGKQNQARVHFVTGQKTKDPRIHPISGTHTFSFMQRSALTGFIFWSYVLVCVDHFEFQASKLRCLQYSSMFSFGYFPGVLGLKADVSEPSIGSIFLGRWRKNNSGWDVSVYLYSVGMWQGSGRANRE